MDAVAAPRKKSPRAPSIALDEALEKADRAYGRERLHPAPTEVVAQNLGYKGANNGSALGALASLRYYGLLERPKEGVLAVSKEYENFKFAPAEAQRQKLLSAFLRSPQLYSDLLDNYVSGLPSDPTLRYDLIQRGFSPAAAESAIVIFRRSVDFVGYYSLIQSDAADDQSDDDTFKTEASAEESAPSNVQSSSVASSGPLQIRAASENNDQIPVRLSGGRRAWLVIPDPLFESDKVRLKAQIDLLLTQDE